MARGAGGSGIHSLFTSWGAGPMFVSITALFPGPCPAPAQNMPWINTTELADGINQFRMQIR